MARQETRLTPLRLARPAATGLSLAGLSYAAYVLLTWLRYGRLASATSQPEELLDRFMPSYEVAERHEVEVNAPADLTFELAKQLDLNRSPLVRAIFNLRNLPARLRGQLLDEPSESLLAQTLRIGWGVLAEAPGREIVVGAVTRPWEPVVQFRAIPPERFADFAEPGYAKIVWTLAADPLGPSRSRFRTATRVQTTDPASRARFRRYWAFLSPGILLIRLEALRLVRREAERAARAAVSPTAPGLPL